MNPMAFLHPWLPREESPLYHQIWTARPVQHLQQQQTLLLMWIWSASASPSLTNRWLPRQLLKPTAHITKVISSSWWQLLLSVLTSWLHGGRAPLRWKGSPTPIKWPMRTAWCGGRCMWTTPNLPKPHLAAFLSPQHLQHQLPRHISTARGICPGESLLLLLNQPPLSQSLLSHALRLTQPHLPWVDPPHAHQPIRKRLPALSKGHRPLSQGPMKIHGWALLYDRSERLKAAAQPINRPTQAAPAHSQPTINMARTFPYSLSYDACIGDSEDAYNFSSVYIEDLQTGRRTYIQHVQQILDLLPRTIDPSSRYTLRGHVTPPGHQRMRDSLRLALWIFLPHDGDFRRAANGLHYYLARQGRRVVLRGGDVTSPLHDSRLHWVHDPQPRQTPSVPPSHSPSSPVNPPVPRINDSVPRITKTVPRNVYPPPRKESTSISIAPSSDVRVRAPLTRIDSSVWQNSSQEICPPVPRNNVTDSDIATAPPPPKRKRNRVQRRERRAREREERARIDEAFNRDARWTIQSSGAPSSITVPDPLTTIGLPHSEPISAMRPAVYPPVTEQGRPATNHNSSLHFRQELGESVGLRSGLYKAPDPDSQHHFRNSSWACSSEDDPPSPTRTSWACSSGARPRTGIIYPLQPRQRRPDTHITVEAASLPEPAALHREELLPSREVPTDLTRPAQRPGRKRRRKRSSALYRPAKRSPPWGRWCIL